jgi:hypothetical protein
MLSPLCTMLLVGMVVDTRNPTVDTRNPTVDTRSPMVDIPKSMQSSMLPMLGTMLPMLAIQFHQHTLIMRLCLTLRRPIMVGIRNTRLCLTLHRPIMVGIRNTRRRHITRLILHSTM